MKAIFKREFLSQFHNVTGFLFCGITLAVFGLYYYVYNLRYGYPYVSYALSGLAFVMLIVVPVVTMRILSEERKNKVDQLLFCAPVSVYEIVLGKYLALLAMFSIVMAIICASPLVLMTFGAVPLAESYTAILGFWLYGACCLAIGLLASALTENQIVSAIISFGLLFLGYMMASILSIFSSENVLTTVLGCYDITSPLDEFLNGSLTLRGIVYYIAMISFLIFVTGQILLKRRFTVSAKKWTLSAFNSGMIVIGLVALILVNFGMSKIADDYVVFDMTEQKLYELEDDTEEYLLGLDQDITIKVLASKDDADDFVKKTLNRMKKISDHISVEYIESDLVDTYATEYTDDSITAGSIVVESAKRFKLIDYYDLYEYSYDSSYSTYASGYDAEGQLVSAMQYVTSDDMPVIYQLTGHNEMSLSDKFLSGLEKSNYDVQSLNLLSCDSIPEDASAVLILGPGAAFSEDDIAKLREYLSCGGTLLVSLDYAYTDEVSDLTELLSDYGINVMDGLIADNDRNYYYSSPFYLLPEVYYSDLVPDYYGTMEIFAPGMVGLTYEDSDTVTVEALFGTSDSAVAKTDYKNATSYEFEDGDIMGPFYGGLYAIGESGEQLVVLGSTEMLTATADSYVANRNSGFFTELCNNIVPDTMTDLVVIPSKSYDFSYLTVSDGCIFWYGFVWGLVLPVLSILIGIIIWARRKRA